MTYILPELPEGYMWQPPEIEDEAGGTTREMLVISKADEKLSNGYRGFTNIINALREHNMSHWDIAVWRQVGKTFNWENVLIIPIEHSADVPSIMVALLLTEPH
jgi:hypothetical protein